MPRKGAADCLDSPPMKSSAGTIPQGLSLYQFAGFDGANRPITTEVFLPNDDAAREYARFNGVNSAIHVLSGREVWP